jgi:hypothetical protein
MAALDHEGANHPGPGVDQEIDHFAHHSIVCFDLVTGDGPRASEM